MASGKTIELNSMTFRGPSWKCLCGKPYDDHRNKNGEIGKRFEDTSKHRPIAGEGMNRAARRKAKYGR